MKKRVTMKRDRTSHKEALAAEAKPKKIIKDSNWLERDEPWDDLELGKWLEKAEVR